jgi:hypothetical protein
MNNFQNRYRPKVDEAVVIIPKHRRDLGCLSSFYWIKIGVYLHNIIFNISNLMVEMKFLFF